MVSPARTLKQVWQHIPTQEGAGVKLNRVFGYHQVPQLDPFLLLDHFKSDQRDDYVKGFPWHPHRGIETITYVLDGDVEHQDSLGNKGVIRPGDVQWMTAGGGIIHQEMPQGSPSGRMWGFQLWANLPQRTKLMTPRYREVTAPQIPVVKTPDGATVRLICGRLGDVQGPVQEIVTDPEYLDVALPPQTRFTHPVKPGYTVFAYVFEGQGTFSPDPEARPASTGSLVLYAPAGETLVVTTQQSPVRFLLVSGKPLNEPVAWAGPIVMNTQAELKTAFREFEAGTFLKRG